MDPENGSSPGTDDVSPETSAPETQDTGAATQSTPELSQDTAPEAKPIDNTVGAAWEAFNSALGRGSTRAVASSQQTTTGDKPIAQPKPRVFDGLAPEEVDYFKQMSNRAYEALYPQWIEAKKARTEREQLAKDLEAARSLHFFEHEGAYRLVPEYSELSQGHDQVTAEVAHWQEQLALVEAGQPWRPLVRNAQGQIVYGESREATPQDKALILNQLSQGHVLLQDLRTKMSSFEGNFKNQHQSYLRDLSQVRSRIFQGADMAKLEAAAKEKLEMFPSAIRGKPEVKMLAEGMVIIEGLIQVIEGMKSSQITQGARARTAANNGPKNGGSGAAVAVKSVGSALEDFKRAGFGH